MIWALLLVAAPTVEACLDASESAQVALREGRLTEARDGFATCAAATCPDVVRRDCVSRRALIVVPSIVLGVVDDADEALDATLRVDGVAREPGRIELDPGRHTVEVTVGARREDHEILVAEDDRDRDVRVVFARVAPVVRTTTSAPTHTRSIALTAIAGAALTTFAIVGGLGVTRYGDIEDQCGRTRTCSPDDTRATKTMFLVADVALVVGLATGIGALISWLWSGPGAEPELTASTP